MSYKIIRFHNGSLGYERESKNRVIKRGLTLEEAQEHCRREDTRKEGHWFDGYDKE